MGRLHSKVKRISTKDGGRRVVQTSIDITRTNRDGKSTGNQNFLACVRIGGKWGRKPKSGCSYGKNPRAALAAALRRAAENVASRGGAFAGYKRRRK